MREEKPLGILLTHCAHLARERMDARVDAYDVTPAQVHVLHYLYHQNNRAFQCDVTAHMKVRPSTANGILDRMEEKGLLKRFVDEQDARKKFVTLTEKGRGMQEALRQKFEETEALLTSGLNGEETRQFRELLLRVIASLEEDRAL